MSVSNPESRRYQDVEVDHPSIVSCIQNAKKLGWTKEKASRVSGMPMEVVDKIYARKED